MQSIVIVGGGAPAWLAAAALARVVKPGFCAVRVLDSPRAGLAAFSESASPSFHRLNGLLGINENDLLTRTRGTFRLGEQFSDWGGVGDRYFHSYGALGIKLDAVPFHHYWLKLRQLGDATRIEQYSTAAVAAKMRRFAHPAHDRHSVLSFYSYGYHFDSNLLERYLKEYAQAHGVTRIEGKIVDAELRGDDGFIQGLKLDHGERIQADLYIDAAGVGGFLHRRLFDGRYADWSRWLPCDRAVSVRSMSAAGEIDPYSESSAESVGWRWRVPLQHGIDNGYAYSSAYVSDEVAAAALLQGLPGPALTEPRYLRLSAEQPQKFWDKNCLLLSGNNFEPLEATRLHQAQTGIMRLLTLFPARRYSPDDIEEYNRLAIMEHERIRDFRILHFKATQRSDSPFWHHCRDMQIPDTLRGKIELFQRCARLSMLDEEHFSEDSWLSLLLGQNITPNDYDPLADVLDVEEARAALLRMRSMIKQAVETLPTHRQFIERNCLSSAEQLGLNS